VLAGDRFSRAATGLDRLVDAPAVDGAPPGAPDGALVTLARDAAQTHALQYVMPAVALVLLVLVVVGFRDRLREYEFGS
jgi:hypothetical protein